MYDLLAALLCYCACMGVGFMVLRPESTLEDSRVVNNSVIIIIIIIIIFIVLSHKCTLTDGNENQNDNDSHCPDHHYHYDCHHDN